MSGLLIRALGIATLTAALIGSGLPAFAARDAARSSQTCPATYPVALGVQTSKPDEVQYLDDILACQDADAAVLVRNNSKMVWVFQGGAGGLFTKKEQPRAAQLFQGAARTVYPYAYMAPGEAVRLPLGAVDVEWAIHPELSFMWFAQEKLTDRVKSTTLTTLKDVLADTKKKKAIVDCALAAWNSSAAVGGVVYGDADAVSIWKAAYGVSAYAGACATSWKAAAKGKGRLVFPAYVDSVIVVGDSARIAGQVTSKVDDLARYSEVVGPFICRLPKMPC